MGGSNPFAVLSEDSGDEGTMLDGKGEEGGSEPASGTVPPAPSRRGRGHRRGGGRQTALRAIGMVGRVPLQQPRAAHQGQPGTGAIGGSGSAPTLHIPAAINHGSSIQKDLVVMDAPTADVATSDSTPVSGLPASGNERRVVPPPDFGEAGSARLQPPSAAHQGQHDNGALVGSTPAPPPHTSAPSTDGTPSAAPQKDLLVGVDASTVELSASASSVVSGVSASGNEGVDGPSEGLSSQLARTPKRMLPPADDSELPLEVPKGGARKREKGESSHSPQTTAMTERSRATTGRDGVTPRKSPSRASSLTRTPSACSSRRGSMGPPPPPPPSSLRPGAPSTSISTPGAPSSPAPRQDEAPTASLISAAGRGAASPAGTPTAVVHETLSETHRDRLMSSSGLAFGSRDTPSAASTLVGGVRLSATHGSGRGASSLTPAVASTATSALASKATPSSPPAGASSASRANGARIDPARSIPIAANRVGNGGHGAANDVARGSAGGWLESSGITHFGLGSAIPSLPLTSPGRKARAKSPAASARTVEGKESHAAATSPSIIGPCNPFQTTDAAFRQIGCWFHVNIFTKLTAGELFQQCLKNESRPDTFYSILAKLVDITPRKRKNLPWTSSILTPLVELMFRATKQTASTEVLLVHPLDGGHPYSSEEKDTKAIGEAVFRLLQRKFPDLETVLSPSDGKTKGPDVVMSVMDRLIDQPHLDPRKKEVPLDFEALSRLTGWEMVFLATGRAQILQSSSLILLGPLIDRPFTLDSKGKVSSLGPAGGGILQPIESEEYSDYLTLLLELLSCFAGTKRSAILEGCEKLPKDTKVYWYTQTTPGGSIGRHIFDVRTGEGEAPGEGLARMQQAHFASPESAVSKRVFNADYRDPHRLTTAGRHKLTCASCCPGCSSRQSITIHSDMSEVRSLWVAFEGSEAGGPYAFAKHPVAPDQGALQHPPAVMMLPAVDGKFVGTVLLHTDTAIYRHGAVGHFVSLHAGADVRGSPPTTGASEPVSSSLQWGTWFSDDLGGFSPRYFRAQYVSREGPSPLRVEEQVRYFSPLEACLALQQCRPVLPESNWPRPGSSGSNVSTRSGELDPTVLDNPTIQRYNHDISAANYTAFPLAKASPDTVEALTSLGLVPHKGTAIPADGERIFWFTGPSGYRSPVVILNQVTVTIAADPQDSEGTPMGELALAEAFASSTGVVHVPDSQSASSTSPPSLECLSPLQPLISTSFGNDILHISDAMSLSPVQTLTPNLSSQLSLSISTATASVSSPDSQGAEEDEQSRVPVSPGGVAPFVLPAKEGDMSTQPPLQGGQPPAYLGMSPSGLAIVAQGNSPNPPSSS